MGLCALTAKGTGSIPGRGPKIPQAMQCSQKIKITKSRVREEKDLDIEIERVKLCRTLHPSGVGDPTALILSLLV